MAGTLTRHEPFGELRGSILDRFFGDWLDARGQAHMPEVDVIRENGSLIVRADMPGIKPEEVKIEIADGVLSVSGGHEETSEEKEKEYVRRERRQGSFYRSLVLPAGVVPSDVKATTHDGVVEVTVPLPKGERQTVSITPTAV